MMSEFRRRLLMQNALKGSSGDLGYIKDGLILHLDGIEKGDDPNAWTDLVKGIKFTYHDCILNQNNVEFDGSKSYADSFTAKSYPQKKSTIEVVFFYNYDTKEQYSRLYSTYVDDSIIAVLDKDERVFTINTRSSEYYRHEMKGKGNRTISAKYELCIENKTKLFLGHGYSANSLNPQKNVTIGCKDIGLQMFKGKIYSIRIYDRQLTEEEMLHNQQVDIDRFFGGVVPQ